MKHLPKPIRHVPTPTHVATNIDGARRWAAQHGVPLDECYDHGFRQVQAIADACLQRGIPALTLHIVRHLDRTIRGPAKWREAIADFARLSLAYLPRWHEAGIRLHLMGDIDGMPADSRATLLRVASETEQYDELHLSMAINYSSRSDGLQAARRLAARCARGELAPEDIDDRLYTEHLWSATLPPQLRAVDMLIITGGVQELDDFMQIEGALASVFFTNSLWPEFSTAEFSELLALYGRRKLQPRSYETRTRSAGEGAVFDRRAG